MVVTILIGSSTETVHRALVSVNRLEASQIADRELALLEAMLHTQKTPPQDKEQVHQEFLIRVVSSLAVEDLGGLSEGNGGSAGRGFPSLSGGAGTSPATLLSLQAPGIEQFLLRYDIIVEWIEGATPGTLTRTTYAFDWEGARAALPDFFAQSGLGGPSDDAVDDLGDSLKEPPRLPGKR